MFAATDFETVFEITKNSNGVFANAILRFLIGVTALFSGVRFLLRNWRRQGGMKDYLGPVFALIWSLSWLYLHNFPHVFGHINRLMKAYREKQYEIVEGQVQLLHQQLATGHSKGDIIRVNEKEFEVNYFYATPAYHNTIAHKGV